MIEIMANDRAAPPEFVASLRRLVELAAHPAHTGGGRVAAKVVLSCYNGTAYPLDVSELGTLDSRHFDDAINVIRLRVQHGAEPHEFFHAGGELFNQIADAWGLHPEHCVPA